MIVVHIGRDNITAYDLEYMPKGETSFVPVPDDTITRAVLRFGPFCLDTNVTGHADIFYLSNSNTTVEMKLGKVANLTTGAYYAYLTIYDANHPNGIPWANFNISVQSWPVC